LTTYRKSYMGFSKNPLLDPKIQDGWDPPSWKSTWHDSGPFWIKFYRLEQNNMTAVIWSKSKRDVKIPIWLTFGRIQSHVILERPATLQGAATWRNQCHDPRPTCHVAGCCNRANWMACHPRAMYHIAGYCHLVNSLSRFQSHIAGCSHLAKSVSWSYHIAKCKNFIGHIENRFSPYFILFLFF